MSAAFRIAAAILSLGLLAGSSFACGGDDDDDDAPEPTPTEASEPTAPSEDTPEGDDDEADDEGEDNGDDGEAPTFEDGDWTGGEIDIRVTTPAKERTIVATLLDQSGTDGLTTRLIYARGIDTVNLSISREYEAFAVSTYFEADGFDGGSAFDHPCEVTYTEVSENSIAGSFRCENGEIGSFPHRGEGPVTLEGSFTATR